MDYELIL